MQQLGNLILPSYIAGSSACIIYVCTEMERREKNKVTVYVCVYVATHFCSFVRLRGNFIVNNVSEELKLVVCHCLSDDIKEILYVPS